MVLTLDPIVNWKRKLSKHTFLEKLEHLKQVELIINVYPIISHQHVPHHISVILNP